MVEDKRLGNHPVSVSRRISRTAAKSGNRGELVLPVLLVIGIFTQLSALGLFVLNIMAVVSYYMALSGSPAALNDHLQWGIILAVLMTMPIHKFSLDYFLETYVLRKHFSHNKPLTPPHSAL